MTRRSSIVLALLVAATLGVGVGAAQRGISEPEPAGVGETGIFVQKSVLFGIPELSFCGSANIYKVPVGKRLRIEWMSVEVFIAPAGGDPVDIDVKTTLNNLEVQHSLVRLDDAINFGESFFFTQRWSGPVTIHGQGNKFVEIVACGNSDSASTSIRATFHGRLVN